MAPRESVARSRTWDDERIARLAELVRAKMERLRDPRLPVAERRPRIVDLFSGCGGLFLGFHRAGARSVGGVEIDSIAAESYATNFHADAPADEFAAHALARDITSAHNTPRAVLESWGHDNHESAVDVIVGGPPCPAFARVGRAKLREVNEHPEAFRLDPRAKLYVPYLKFVEELAPVALLMENVPDILNYGGHNLGEEICEALDGLGYACAYTLLNAANYGVPQMRERFFLIAVHEAAGGAPSFPIGTHAVTFPAGYEGSRQVALKHISTSPEAQIQLPGAVPRPELHYVRTPGVRRNAPPPVTAQQALADLLPLTAHLEGKDRRGARRFVNGVGYRDDVEPTSYARDLRTWPCFPSTGEVKDHVTRCLTDRDYRLFKRMRSGDDYPKAYALAESLFEAEIRRLGAAAPRHGTTAWKDLVDAFVPPYDPDKFPNKWRKMERDEPARTLMAHLGKDTYSHIHYDSKQARTISVREAARLQSFPDGFVFRGTMNPAFRQIGNSVPPLLSFALARHIFDALELPSRPGLLR